MNRIISTKDLSKNAQIIRESLKKNKNKLFFAKDLNQHVIKNLGCSLRTAQRVIKELHNSQQVTLPIVYRITIKS